jgi:hypothetical protein
MRKVIGTTATRHCNDATLARQLERMSNSSPKSNRHFFVGPRDLAQYCTENGIRRSRGKKPISVTTKPSRNDLSRPTQRKHVIGWNLKQHSSAAFHVQILDA